MYFSSQVPHFHMLLYNTIWYLSNWEMLLRTKLQILFWFHQFFYQCAFSAPRSNPGHRPLPCVCDSFSAFPCFLSPWQFGVALRGLVWLCSTSCRVEVCIHTTWNSSVRKIYLPIATRDRMGTNEGVGGVRHGDTAHLVENFKNAIAL